MKQNGILSDLRQVEGGGGSHGIESTGGSKNPRSSFASSGRPAFNQTIPGGGFWVVAGCAVEALISVEYFVEKYFLSRFICASGGLLNRSVSISESDYSQLSRRQLSANWEVLSLIPKRDSRSKISEFHLRYFR